jgi:hypothetical protein
MSLENPVVQSLNGTFIVKSISNPKQANYFPVNGDSININAGKIADKLNNFQDNVNNKRVALKVHPVRYKLSNHTGCCSDDKNERVA